MPRVAWAVAAAVGVVAGAAGAAVAAALAVVVLAAAVSASAAVASAVVASAASAAAALAAPLASAAAVSRPPCSRLGSAFQRNQNETRFLPRNRVSLFRDESCLNRPSAARTCFRAAPLPSLALKLPCVASLRFSQ